MDQKKIGLFLKELRNEQATTQQKFAEYIGVSNRTVSRWETGSNMPDLDVLIQIADYYEVEIREILDGERKSEKMNKELKETVLKVADYSNEERKKLSKRMHILFLVAILAFLAFMVMDMIGVSESGLTGFIKGISLGISFGMLIVGALITSKYFDEFRKAKRRLLRLNR